MPIIFFIRWRERTVCVYIYIYIFVCVYELLRQCPMPTSDNRTRNGSA